MVRGQKMEWEEDALATMNRIPETARSFVKTMVEQYAEQESIKTITDELIINLRKKFEQSYGKEQRHPLFNGSKAR